MTLRRFLGLRHDLVLQAWHAAVRRTASREGSPDGSVLGDTAADLLQSIEQALDATPEAEDVHASPGVDLLTDEGAAARHGGLLQRQGGTAAELAGQFGALRAVVLRLWAAHPHDRSAQALDEAARFDSVLDQALIRALQSFSHASAQRRDTFLAVVGHDLRNPLGSLAGCLELLENPTLPRFRRQRSVEIARRSVSTIDSMVNDLLEYTRTRLGQNIQVQPVPSDLVALCREAVDETQAAYPSHRFVAMLPERLRADFDAPRLRQVLTNLLSNAVHHGEAGSPITIRAAEAGTAHAIEVRNLGRPIPADLMQAIFDPLVQIPAAASEHPQRPATSLGLGLFIAREIIAAHGGRIDVASSADAGTTFTVVLPHRAGTSGDAGMADAAGTPGSTDAAGTSGSTGLSGPF